MALADSVAAYHLMAGDHEQLSKAAGRYFKSQPIDTASMILVTGLRRAGRAEVGRALRCWQRWPHDNRCQPVMERFFIHHRRWPELLASHRFQMIRASSTVVSRRSILPTGNLATLC